MNTLTQLDNLLIGSQNAVETLAEKTHARVLVISDSHGAYEEFSLILERFGNTCDALFFCGDGSLDLIKLLQNFHSDPEKNKYLPSVVAIVRGNGDSSSYPIEVNLTPDRFSIPDNQTVTVNGKRIFITHGHKEYIDYSFEDLGLKLQLQQCDFACYGHTHISADDRDDNFRFINPGSISRPRGSSPFSFAILTVEKTFIDCAFLEIKKGFGNQRDYKIYTPLS